MSKVSFKSQDYHLTFSHFTYLSYYLLCVPQKRKSNQEPTNARVRRMNGSRSLVRAGSTYRRNHSLSKVQTILQTKNKMGNKC